MQTIKLQQRGVLTLPKSLRDVLGFSEGQSFRVQYEGKKVILEPEESFDAQLMQDLKEGMEDIKNGRFIEFSSIKEFHEKLAKYEG
jgi:bifunctional DNA-binding transcriptional regulator/antitoxin component of YhaV-PrlF toxin-antitoxin module